MPNSVFLTPLPYLVATQRFGDRLRKAILDYQSQIGRKVGYAELGALFAKRERRKTPYTASAVSEWVSGRSNPGPEAITAIALTLGVTTDSLLMPTNVPRSENGNVPRDDRADEREELKREIAAEAAERSEARKKEVEAAERDKARKKPGAKQGNAGRTSRG